MKVCITLHFPWHEEEQRFGNDFDEPGMASWASSLTYDGEPPTVNDLIEVTDTGNLTPRTPPGTYMVGPRTLHADKSSGVGTSESPYGPKTYYHWEVPATWVPRDDEGDGK